MDVPLILGSDSDLGKLEEGILKASEELGPDFTVAVRFASAHRTPERVAEYVSEHDRAIISGAGLAAQLTGKIVAELSDVRALNIGIPVADTATGGVSAFLSIAELPPNYPALCVGVNNSYAAVRLAHLKLTNEQRNKVIIVEDQTTSNYEDFSKLVSLVKKFSTVEPVLMNGNDLVKLTDDDKRQAVFIYHFRGDAEPVSYIDQMADGAPVVAVRCKPQVRMRDMREYVDAFTGAKITGAVRIGDYQNAVWAALRFLPDDKVDYDDIERVMAEKRDSYETMPEINYCNGKKEVFDRGEQ